MRRMRWLLCALIIGGWAEGAAAADLPLLRGSNTFEVGAPFRWDGIYFGGQFGAGVAGTDFVNTTGAISTMLSGAPFTSASVAPFGTDDRPNTHFGGFIGYNTQWDGAILGVEGNYNHYNNTQMTSTDQLSGTYLANDGNIYPFTGTGTATARITDVGTFRVRGGWATGSFMPYAFVGVAVAHTELDRSATVTLTPPLGSPAGAPLTISTSETGQFTYGWTACVGLDFALMNNIFIRAEYEYIQFGDFLGVNMHMQNARLGVAAKF